MTDMVKLHIDGEERDVETKPITLLCHPGNVNIQPVSEDVLEIDPQATVRYADSIPAGDWDWLRTQPRFLKMWGCVFPGIEPPVTLKGEGLGYRHVVGLIVLLVKAVSSGKRPLVRLPESYLHPRAQLGLADLFILLAKGGV